MFLRHFFTASHNAKVFDAAGGASAARQRLQGMARLRSGYLSTDRLFLSMIYAAIILLVAALSLTGPKVDRNDLRSEAAALLDVK